MRPKGTVVCILHENAKHRVLDNMTKICTANSKDCVMCSGRGSLEEHSEKMISTKKQGGENDSERQKGGKMVTQNAWMSMHNNSEHQN